jgi:hypothetical protein
LSYFEEFSAGWQHWYKEKYHGADSVDIKNYELKVFLAIRLFRKVFVLSHTEPPPLICIPSKIETPVSREPASHSFMYCVCTHSYARS